MAAVTPDTLVDNGMLATRTGYVPDLPDKRDTIFIDTLYQEIARTGVHLQAGSVQDVSPGVYNQYNLGSCVANAVAMALRYGKHKIHGEAGDTTFQPSRLFIWYFAKFLGGEDAKKKQPGTGGGEEAVKYNTGCQIRNAIKVIEKYGTFPEDKWPYPTGEVQLLGDVEPKQVPADLATAPTEELMKLAKEYCNLKLRYFRIITVAENARRTQDDGTTAPLGVSPSRVEQIRSCLAEGYPVIFAIKIFQTQNPQTQAWEDSWNPINWHNMDQTVIATKGDDDKVTKSAQWSVREAPADEKLGEWRSGHCMLVIAYHRDLIPPSGGKSGMFLIQNSWGEGYLPYFWVPYSYFERELVHDTWVIKIDGLLNAPDDKRDGWDKPQ